MPSYHPKVIEPRWQKVWEDGQTFRTPDDSEKPKYYILDMFPYPSGQGLHVGHPEGYTATDILARYKRMCGFNVLHPMGWDAFGLPAEQYAVEHGKHPRATTEENINVFRRQIKMLGFSYDWDREVDTTDPGYFKWTQWIFLQLFDTWYDREQKRGRPIDELPIPADVAARGENAVRDYQNQHRLAYQAEVPVNWCAALGTVLANEEVINGKSERGNHPVVRMPLRQWLLRITDYAERLLEDLETVDWPAPIKHMQREWIGRSEGAEVDFTVRWNSSDPPVIRVFTTRPDTLFGATYMVLAPEHPLVEKITSPAQHGAVAEYRQQAAAKSDLERTELNKKKTGVFTGAYALNPVNGEAIPIWIADYVLATYGTGAIMAVPAHDLRDYEFARQYKLATRPVVLPPLEWLEASLPGRVLLKSEAAFEGVQAATLTQQEYQIIKLLAPVEESVGRDRARMLAELYRRQFELFGECYAGDGTAINSGEFDGLPTREFKARITAFLASRGKGHAKVNFKLRDWLFSRQRYWGEPFPILHEVDDTGNRTGRIEPLTLSELPLRLPELEDYKPSGRPEPPLAKARAWVEVQRGGRRFQRETNTMPQWAGSCWYFLRYLDPHNDQAFAAADKLKRWLPVDLYIGGAEHAVLHLLYSRFWHKVLYDRGHVPVPEPFQKLVNQGMILGETDYHVSSETYAARKAAIDQLGLQALRVQDDDREIVILRNPPTADKKYSPLTEEQVVKEGGKTYLKDLRIEVFGRSEKMSKARGNVINPDEVVKQYGADSLRLYEMFMGPLEATKPWSMRGVEGVYRFLNRVWRLLIDDRAETTRLNDTVQDVEPDAETRRLLHHTIQRVTEGLDTLSFNTAIAAMMEFTNHLTPQTVRSRSALRTFVLLLSPFAPHIAEELWASLGGQATLAYEPWPSYDPALLKKSTVEIPVQINGKLRSKVTVPADVSNKDLEMAALSDEKVLAAIGGKTIHKIVVVPGKLVNIVA